MEKVYRNYSGISLTSSDTAIEDLVDPVSDLALANKASCSSWSCSGVLFDFLAFLAILLRFLYVS